MREKYFIKDLRFAIVLLLIIASAITAANAQTAKESGHLQEAERLIKSISLGNDNPSTLYNVAYLYALAGKTDDAFLYLNRAVQRGFLNIAHMRKDSDLNSLRGDARWRKLIEKAEAKTKENQTAFWNKKEFWDNPALKTPYRENIGEDEKLVGLSKFWSEVKYNFANFDLVPDVDWDALYLEYVPKVRNTKSTLEYYRVLQELCARLRDGHTNVYFPEQLYNEANARPLMRTRFIEGRVLIAAVFDEALKRNGIERGQEITEINGVPVKQYVTKSVMPYQSASTRQDLETQTYERFLFSGSAKEAIEVTLSDATGKVFKRKISRLTREEVAKQPLRTAPFEFKMLPGNVAYVALNSFNDNRTADMFAAAFDEIAKSNALIIDIRENPGGNSGVGYGIIAHLTDQPFKLFAWHTRQYRPSFRPWERPQEVYGSENNVWQPNGKKFYARPVVVLTSPRTGSAAEDFLVAFVSLRRGSLIGEPTGGSTGQPLFFSLPGGGQARVCSQRIKFPDGREFVGKGIQPDKAVFPTVADFRAGRDTVLEAAIKELTHTNSTD